MPDYLPERRTIIVVRAEHQVLANQIAQDATRAADGSVTTDLNTFSDKRLQTAGQAPAVGTVVAYWTAWKMTQAHRDALIAAIGTQFKQEAKPIPLGGRPQMTDPFWIFDAEDGQWTPEQAVAALGMEPVPVPD